MDDHDVWKNVRANPSWMYHDRFNDHTETPILDELIPAIFDAIDTGYEERADAKIRALFISYVDTGLFDELRTLAENRHA